MFSGHAGTLFCFLDHIYSSYFILTIVQRKLPCFPSVKNNVFPQLQ